MPSEGRVCGRLSWAWGEWLGGGAWSVEEIDEVANILFVGHGIGGFWREGDERFEEVGEIGEEANPGIWVEGFSANN